MGVQILQKERKSLGVVRPTEKHLVFVAMYTKTDVPIAMPFRGMGKGGGRGLIHVSQRNYLLDGVKFRLIC